MQELLLPIRDTDITQPFGVNWVKPGFYKSLGIPTDKHNGLDFLCVIGTPITASMSGKVTLVSKDRNSGLGVEISDGQHKTIYWHLDKTQVDLKQNVKAGEMLVLVVTATAPASGTRWWSLTDNLMATVHFQGGV
jgi:murein DD-endopeptidase MepM/ murein hydrolase activator NlpD